MIIIICLSTTGCETPGLSKNDNEETFTRSGEAEAQYKSEDIFSGSISIIMVTEHDDMKGYSAGASGVIVKKDNSTYYALTAYHVVADKGSCIILTTFDETLSDYRKNSKSKNFTSVEAYYNQLQKAKIEYICEESDLAIISFEYNKELKVVSISQTVPEKGDNVVFIGTLEGNYFEETYGVIISGKLETFKTNDGQSKSKVLKHSAYVTSGSSGGGIFNTENELIGINIGGGTNVFGKFKYGVMIPCDQIHDCINAWVAVSDEG